MHDPGIVLIVRLDDAASALAAAEAAIEGGIRAVEITYSVPGALDVIAELARRHRGDGTVIGAGTVLDAESAHAAIRAGAGLLVSPQLSPAMIEISNRYQCVSVGGAFTPTEIVQSMSAGADVIKLFPAEAAGPDYLAAVLAPLPHAPIAPTGGVTVENVSAWIHAGAACLGVGSAVTKAGGGDPERISAAARAFVDAVATARG